MDREMYKTSLPSMKTAALFLTLVLSGASLTAQTAAAAGTETIFQHLTKTEGTAITLEVDLNGFIADKRNKNYFPAVLKTEDGSSYDVEIRPRGRYRRMNADIPPFKIRFKKNGLLAKGLDSLNEIKVALPMNKGMENNELLVKEYLAYRMFEQITNTSLRARLVKLSLVDNKNSRSRPRAFMAIFMEDEEEAAARLGGMPVERYGVAAEQLDTRQAALVALFQYMIGNTDWDLEMQRNVRLIQMNGTGKILVIPYDFDFCGLVNAPYASPASGTGLDTVRDRILMAGNLPDESILYARQILLQRQSDFYALCRSEHLSRPTVNQMIRYLDDFFSRIEARAEIPVMMRM